MTVPEERERWTVTPPHTLPEPRQPADERATAWFTYTAAGDQIVWSPAFAAMVGRVPVEKGKTRQILARHVHRDDHAKALGAITEAWTSQTTVHTTVRLMRADGGWFDIDCTLEPMAGPEGAVRGIRGTVRDVSARERARRESARLTRRGETVQASLVEPDPATGLLIRARFADEIDRALRGAGGALLVVRVQAGDTAEGVRPDHNAEMLHRAARQVEEKARPEYLIGRVGPNEIGVLFARTTWRAAREQARDLIAALGEQSHCWGGLVRFERDAEAGSHGLLIDAEQAWRQSREADRSITLVAHPVPVRDRQGSYRSRVADALGTDRFTLYSQPILELQSNRVTRHELLLRVLDEADGPQSPIQVLDTAERLDAIFDIDLWVVERAMRLAAEQPGLCLQVNLSGRSVGDPRLTNEVEKLLERYRVDPAQLTFEITETALIGNLSEARRFADRVRDLGCGLALDDFGSGYASFRYLRLFPIDLVKIDGEYVVDLVDNPQDQVLVRALVQVCQAYGIHTVAEFVQDEATLRMLRELGVDYVQGYLIGRPSPVVPGGLLSPDLGNHEVMEHFTIATVAEQSPDFRRVLWTGKHTQLVIMTVPPGGEIGEEVHEVDQILTFVSGVGKAVVSGETRKVAQGDLVVVPAGRKHNFINEGPNPLVLYTVYGPPEHADGAVHKTKEEADALEEAGKDEPPAK